jgi:hypothetical protein
MGLDASNERGRARLAEHASHCSKNITPFGLQCSSLGGRHGRLALFELSNIKDGGHLKCFYVGVHLVWQYGIYRGETRNQLQTSRCSASASASPIQMRSRVFKLQIEITR